MPGAIIVTATTASAVPAAIIVCVVTCRIIVTGPNAATIVARIVIYDVVQTATAQAGIRHDFSRCLSSARFCWRRD